MATITVTNLLDAGAGSLRQAVADANSGDTIVFDPSLAGGTITLTSGDINISQTLTIDGDTDGDNAADITIDANGGAGAFDIVGVTQTVTISSINGTGSAGQSFIRSVFSNDNTLTVEHSSFTGNSAQDGGAIKAIHRLNIDTSTFTGNTATGNTIGGRGGAVYAAGSNGPVSITNSTFVGNTAEGVTAPGGIGGSGGAVSSSMTVGIVNSTFTGNAATDGFDTSTSTAVDGQSGGVHVLTIGANFTLTNSIISGNTASNGANTSSPPTTDNGGNVIDGDASLIFGSNVLADNGGPVQTIALVNAPTNPALDVAASSLTTDARGESRFDVASTGNDGSNFADSGAYELQCFAAGTMIATPEGEALVEALCPGDLVLTQDGRAEPIVWIGTQRVDAARALDPRVTPVTLREGAFGDVPTRDLTVTAEHAIALEGLLINAACLVGLEGVDWAAPAPRVFYHIETEAHEVLLANGCPAESLLAQQGRRMFDNSASAPDRIFPEMKTPRIAAPRLLPGAFRFGAGAATPRASAL